MATETNPIYASENPMVCDTTSHPSGEAEAQATQQHIFRLIELLRGGTDDPLKANLLTYKLEQAPEYEALSYVWGDIKSGEKLLCNDEAMGITVNLEAALRRVRLKDDKRIIWVDAICINQGNDRERSHHVSFMNEIYKKAKSVLVCMGEPTDGAAEVVQALITEHVNRVEAGEPTGQMQEIDASDQILKDSRWKSMGALMHCKWFTRAWVLQEVGVAKDPCVLYGNIEFKYRDLMGLARWIVQYASSLQPVAGIDLLTIHTDWEDWSSNWRAKNQNNYTLLDFLSHAKGLGCHDKHDHVYAFLGHPLFQRDDGSGPFLMPDYENKTVEGLYGELTEWMLPRLGLRVLSAVEHDLRGAPGSPLGSTIDEDVPSWVVRWDMDVIWNSMGYYSPFYYRASGEDAEVPEAPQNGVLKVQATPVDIVAATYQFSQEEAQWTTTDALTFLKSTRPQDDVLGRIWRDVRNDATPCKYSSDERVDAMSLTLAAGLRNYGSAEDDLEQHRANFAAFWELRHSLLSAESRQSIAQGSADDFLFDMNLSCKGRSFFITEQGYYGLGPWIMKPGDDCRILKGARVPFVLRQVRDGFFKLLGEAYVHGVMKDQMVKEWSSLDIS